MQHSIFFWLAWAFFGSFLYNYILFQIAKDKCDAIGSEFPYKRYAKMNWDNWLLTTLFAPVLVYFLPDLIALANQKLNWDLKINAVYYLLSGPLTEYVLFLVFKILGWKKTWVAPVHVDDQKPS